MLSGLRKSLTSNRRFMKLNKKEKTGIAIWCAWLAICIPTFIWAKDWASIIWQVTFTLCLVLYAKMQRKIDAQDEEIKWRDEHYNIFSVRLFEKRNECLMKNCSRYLATIAKLKRENGQLKSLVKNLMDDNSNKGVKNHARTTKQRNR